MSLKSTDKYSQEQDKVLESVKVSRIILPIIIGLLVVAYFMWRQFDPEEFANIQWTIHALIWTIIAFILLIIRHLAYAYRLRLLSNKEFGWWKSIELIFIWEFSSAVSPTSVGGSGVALFMLAQEKLTAAKTTAIVIYTIIADTLFYLIAFPILFLILGTEMIRPGLMSLYDIDGWGLTFMGIFIFMSIYGSILFYGLFIQPIQFKRLAYSLARWKFFKRIRKDLQNLGVDIVEASKDLRGQSASFHIKNFLATSTAWICRFLILNALVIAFVENTPMDFWNQLLLFARSKTMFFITAFSPTPGGAGLAEAVFGGFMIDFIPPGIAILIAFFWRIITYYFYLLAGAIIVPAWVRKVIIRRKRNRHLSSHNQMAE